MKKKLVLSDEIAQDHAKEAKFWEDNMDQAWDEGQAVELDVSPNLASNFVVDLNKSSFSRLTKIAHKEGISPKILVQRWIAEKANSMNL